MKNQREVMRALLDGEDLIYLGHTGSRNELKLQSDGNTCNGEAGGNWGISEPERFSIKLKEITVTKSEFIDILDSVYRLKGFENRKEKAIEVAKELFNNKK